MNVLDLFSGIGGFSLGLERAGMRTIAFCEIDPFCRRVLAKHWPDVPIHEDITKLTASDISEPVDVICGGFPCQPFSTASAGRRVAKDYWPEFARLIQEILPAYVVAENVAEIPIKRAERFFQEIGYRSFRKRISGADCGADYLRNRWWACAYPNSDRELHSTVNAETSVLPELCSGLWGAENYTRTFRVFNGVSDRVDRNKSLGNAVVPQIPEIIGRAIMQAEARTT